MISVTRKTRGLEGLLKRMKDAQKSNVTSGYHSDAGIHPIIGKSFVEIMTDHEYGYEGDLGKVPSRPVRQLTYGEVAGTPSVWNKAVKEYVAGSRGLQPMLNLVGFNITNIAVDMFGDNTILANNSWATQVGKGGLKDPQDTPLEDSGELRDAWTWKENIKI